MTRTRSPGGGREVRAVRRSIALGAAAALVLSLAASGTAHATYPGSNGRIVFASNIRGSWQLYSMRPNGLGVRQLTHLAHSPISDLQPDYSPDGKLIVFAGVRHHTNQLFTMNADGTHVRLLFDDPQYFEAKPRWSPDGSRIVFARCGDFSCGIAAIHSDGSGLRQLTPIDSTDYGPEFTTDGTRIVFESQRQGLISAIWVMDTDGSNPHRLTPARLQAGAPDVSPDGHRVVFIDNQNYPAPNELWVMNLDGSGLTQLTTSVNGHHDVWPTWSPDGRFIAFASDRDHPDLCCLDVWRMDADGTHLRPLTSNLTPDGCENDNCVYPDWGPG